MGKDTRPGAEFTDRLGLGCIRGWKGPDGDTTGDDIAEEGVDVDRGAGLNGLNAGMGIGCIGCTGWGPTD